MRADHARLRLQPRRGLSVGDPADGTTQLRDDLERFIFLLGGCDGEPLFQPASSKTLAGGRQGWPLVPEICGGAARQRR